MPVRLTLNEIDRRMKENYPHLNYKILTYTGLGSKLQITCKDCGHTEIKTYYKLSQTTGCQNCRGHNTLSKTNLKFNNIQEVRDKVREINPDITVLEFTEPKKYVGKETPNIKCKCNICGYEYTTYWAILRQGCKCLQCSYETRNKDRRITRKEFEKRIKHLNLEILSISDEEHISYSMIKCKCKECGNIFKRSAHKLLYSDAGCGKHNLNWYGTSKIEKDVSDYVKTIYKGTIKLNDRTVLHNYETDAKRELDIFLPDLRIGIEVDGSYFHNTPEAKIKDAQKDRMCENLAINLLRLPEDEIRNDWGSVTEKVKTFIEESFNRIHKAIILKDTHFRFGFKPPIGRTEDFEAQIKAKIDQVVKLAKEVGAETLILTGDSIDKNSMVFKQFRATIDIYNVLRTQFRCILDIYGNHNLKYSSKDFKNISALGMMEYTDKFVSLSSSVRAMGYGYYIYGVDYTDDVDKLLEQMKDTDEQHKGKKLIAVIHEHLVPTDKDRLPFTNCLTYNEITKGLKNHTHIIAGHLHKGYPIKVVNGITIINIWNFTRLSRTYYALNGEHIPEAAILDFKTGVVDVIKLKCEPYKTAFIEKELQREQNLGMDITEFIAKTTEAQQDNNISFYPAHLKSKIEYYLEQAQRT